MTDNGRLAAELARRGLDVTRPNVARIYDYFLGGKDNFAADRHAADELARLIPGSAEACRQNREFLSRVIRYLAGEAGIRQFLDIGSGLPTTSSVHEIATDIDPDARVAYVDYDPVVALHSQVILKEKAKTTAVAEADLRDPQSIIDNPRVRQVIDFTQPVAVLLFPILHFITDDDKPQEILRHLTGAMAPGSYLALSHITGDDIHDKRSRAAQQVYQGASAPAVPRSHGQIIQFFDGLQIMNPGLTDIRVWPGPSPHIAPSAPRLIVRRHREEDGWTGGVMPERITFPAVAAHPAGAYPATAVTIMTESGPAALARETARLQAAARGPLPDQAAGTRKIAT